jgi:hypothetical protein
MNDTGSNSRRPLLDRLDSFADAWRPQAGDKLVGIVVDLDLRSSQFDEEPYPIVTVRVSELGSTEQGGRPIPPGSERSFHAFHTVARNEVARQQPALGQTVGIASHGRHDRGYERYRVIVERPPNPLPERALIDVDEEPPAPTENDDPAVPF